MILDSVKTDEILIARPYGIGGWLACYVLSCLLLTRIWTIYVLRSTTHPTLNVIACTFAVVGFVAGILLLGKNSSAPFFVALVIALHVLYAFEWICVTLRSHPVRPVAILMILAVNLGVSIAWLLYFNFSRRVLNTLGRNFAFSRKENAPR